MLIENCLQQVNASRADRKAHWCLLEANTLQPQISSFLSDSDKLWPMTYRSYRYLLQRPLAEYSPMQLLMVCCAGVVVLAALFEPLNELCVKRS